MIDWSKYPSFTEEEMACSHTGLTGVKPELMDNLQDLRDRVGVLQVSSGYRAVAHPIEAKKERAGAHTTGLAVDIKCFGGRAHAILGAAIEQGCWTGIGINMRGDHSQLFIHLDCLPIDGLTGYGHIGRPTLWSY